MTTLISITILAGIVLATMAGEMVRPDAEANATALRSLWSRMRPFRIASRRILVGCAAAFLVASCGSPVASADPVPAGRRIDWTYTGVPGGIPNRTTICATFSPGATASAINNAISSCNNGVVFLNAGTYTSASLRGSINVNQSNVTLRGAGANQTIITGQGSVNMVSGSNVSLGTAITGGSTKGSTTFTVASTANLTPGTMIEIDRADDTTLIVNTGNQGGGTRNMTQVNMITAVNGFTITVRNPLIYDFSTGSPKVKFYFSGVTQNSGVENLKLDHTGFSGGGYNFFIQYCDSCWLKGVELAFATGFHFIILGALNLEVRDSYIHDGATGPDNSGLCFYGNYLYGGNSSAKIENNIFNKNFPAVELNNSSSGFYIGYNYIYGSNGGSIGQTTWTLDDGHTPFNIMNLYEGNVSEMWGADNYFGGSGYGTALRNYFTGYNPNYPVPSEAVWLDRLAYDYNVVGNVLGSTLQAPAAYTGCTMYSTARPGVYRLGYPNLGNCGTTPWDGVTPAGGYPDPKVTATLLRWGNYVYFNKATQFAASEIPAGVPMPPDQTIPNSYVYAGTPGWWKAGIAWPPIGPDVTGGNGDTSGHVNKIPAQVCWETSNLVGGGSFNANACYAAGSPPPPPPLKVPLIGGSLTASGTAGTPFSYTITASNNPASFSATGLPAGLSVTTTTGVISGTPTAAGTSSVALSATNAAGTGTATLTLTINTAPPPPPAVPSVRGSAAISGTVGTPFSYTIVALNNPTSFNATGLPSSLAINTATGVISGTPTTAGVYSLVLSATNAAGTGTGNFTLTINVAGPPPTGSSLFSGINVPPVVIQNDPQSVELGVKFYAARTGHITGVRFYKNPQDTGTHTAHLWSATGTLLASATFASETASGWQQVNLPTPVAINANTTYIVSYHSNGDYSETDNYFAIAYTNGPLTAPSSPSSGGNGVYAYGSNVSFPNNTYIAANYWVDVVLQ